MLRPVRIARPAAAVETLVIDVDAIDVLRGHLRDRSRHRRVGVFEAGAHVWIAWAEVLQHDGQDDPGAVLMGDRDEAGQGG